MDQAFRLQVVSGRESAYLSDPCRVTSLTYAPVLSSRIEIDRRACKALNPHWWHSSFVFAVEYQLFNGRESAVAQCILIIIIQTRYIYTVFVGYYMLGTLTTRAANYSTDFQPGSRLRNMLVSYLVFTDS